MYTINHEFLQYPHSPYDWPTTNRYFLSTYYVQSIVLDPGDTTLNKGTEFLLSRKSQSSRRVLLLLLSLKYLFMAKKLKWDTSGKIICFVLAKHSWGEIRTGGKKHQVTCSLFPPFFQVIDINDNSGPRLLSHSSLEFFSILWTWEEWGGYLESHWSEELSCSSYQRILKFHLQRLQGMRGKHTMRNQLVSRL